MGPSWILHLLNAHHYIYITTVLNVFIHYAWDTRYPNRLYHIACYIRSHTIASDRIILVSVPHIEYVWVELGIKLRSHFSVILLMMNCIINNHYCKWPFIRAYTHVLEYLRLAQFLHSRRYQKIKSHCIRMSTLFALSNWDIYKTNLRPSFWKPKTLPQRGSQQFGTSMSMVKACSFEWYLVDENLKWVNFPG